MEAEKPATVVQLSNVFDQSSLPPLPPLPTHPPPPYSNEQGTPEDFNPPDVTCVQLRVRNVSGTIRNNKPQVNAVAAAALIFISGGMKLAWTIGFRSPMDVSLHIRIAWFIGAIAGALLSCLLRNVLKIRLFQICGLLLMGSGIAMILARYNELGLALGLYTDGLANGLVFGPTLALAGELAMPTNRGTLSVFMEQHSFALGILLQIICSMVVADKQFKYARLGGEQIPGGLSFFLGIFAIILAHFHTLESPVTNIRRGRWPVAFFVICTLQRPIGFSEETITQLEELRDYVEESQSNTLTATIRKALPTWLCLCILRGLCAMSMSAFVAKALAITATSVMSPNYYIVWPYIVFAICRFLGNFSCLCFMESLGRKPFTLAGLLFCGVLAIFIGFGFNDLYVFSSLEFSNYVSKAQTTYALICTFQLFAGLAFTPTSAYLTECYPLRVKEQFISLTFIVELIVQVIISVCNVGLNGCANYFFYVAGCYCLAFLLVHFVMPETKRTSLGDALERFTFF